METESFWVNANEWGGRGRGEIRKLVPQDNKRSYEIWCYKNSSVGSSNHWQVSVVVYDISGTSGENDSPVIQCSGLFIVCHWLWASCSRQVLSHPFPVPTLLLSFAVSVWCYRPFWGKKKKRARKMQWCIRLNTVGAQLLRELLCLTMVLTVLGLRLWQKKYWSAWICPTNHMLPLDHQPNPQLSSYCTFSLVVQFGQTSKLFKGVSVSWRELPGLSHAVGFLEFSPSVNRTECPALKVWADFPKGREAN